jgi:hypothetical protein
MANRWLGHGALPPKGERRNLRVSRPARHWTFSGMVVAACTIDGARCHFHAIPAWGARGRRGRWCGWG